MRIPREAGSNLRLWQRLRAAARKVGAQAAFPDATSSEVLDDHTPFARRGVPAIDLIDFTFPCWHQECDDINAVSARSLDLTGETVVQMLLDFRR
jgi:glutaminyl-peptide cyclotransferase